MEHPEGSENVREHLDMIWMEGSQATETGRTWCRFEVLSIYEVSEKLFDFQCVGPTTRVGAWSGAEKPFARPRTPCATRSPWGPG